MSEDDEVGTTGCDACWPGDPEAAWLARRALTRVMQLIDESHFRVSMLACPHCGQAFVSVFAETVDWADGDDPQYWTVVPITTAESDALRAQGDGATEAAVGALGPGRRCLRRDLPKGAEQRIYWGTGLAIGPHD